MDSTASTPQTPAVPTVPLAVSDQQTSALLDDTLALLGTGIPDAATAGSTEIERWEAVLAASDRPGLAKITQELAQLRALLADPQAQSHDVAELLGSLSAETTKVADEMGNGYAAPLTNLATLLRKAANSLSR